MRIETTTDLDELRPLWLALKSWHGSIGGEIGAVRDDEDSWARRKANYVEWLGEEGTFILVARDGAGTALGYAVAFPAGESPTWKGLEAAVQIADLAVLPDARRGGIGRALIDAVREHSGRDTVRLMVVGTNAEARAFYAALGFQELFVELQLT
jgi:ribosomal protein S18 acetylase RimI-like enzyme